MTDLVFCCDRYAVRAGVCGVPSIYSEYVRHAALSKDLGIRSTEEAALLPRLARNRLGLCEWSQASRSPFTSRDSGLSRGFKELPEDLVMMSAP
jgi:hypothetical protein